MSGGLGMQVKIGDTATPQLVRLALAADPARLLPFAGRAAATVVRDHLVALNTDRHRSGGRNYYFQASRSVHSDVVGSRAVVSINQIGIAQRYFGGPIVAGANGSGKKWLTIPARSEAYGNRAGEFNDLHFVFFREGLAALVQNEQSSLGGRRGAPKGSTVGGGVFFWLVRSVDQEADPTVLPTAAEMTGAAITAVGKQLVADGGRGGVN